MTHDQGETNTVRPGSDDAGGHGGAMGCYDRLEVGAVVVTPARTVTEAMVSLLTSLCGYIHPLFNDAVFVKESTSFKGQLLPGELTLALLGGLAEQTDVFDDTVIALIGIDAVRFVAPVLAGDTIHLVMQVKKKGLSPGGRRGLVTFGWTCKRHDGAIALTAEATLAMRVNTETAHNFEP